jgi:Flp pilus assembly pilin Flp
MRNFEIIAWKDERGATAVEFAIVGPLFIATVIGMLYLCMCLLVVGSLHYAVEEGARCASVRTTICSDETAIVSYAQSRYFGPSSSPTFTYEASACGKLVSGSIDYVVDIGLKQITVPITATACFP